MYNKTYITNGIRLYVIYDIFKAFICSLSCFIVIFFLNSTFVVLVKIAFNYSIYYLCLSTSEAVFAY